ncbi:MAG: DUF2510 domain-containing protein [Acidimicrobiales bacterium]
MTGLVIPRTGWYLTLGIVFGMLAFMRSNAYRRRTGTSPWHIHPLVWGIVSVFVTFLVTLMSIVFVAIFGTLLSIFAWSPRFQPGRGGAGRGGAGYAHGSVPSPFGEPGMPGATPPSPRASALRAWLTDPTGRNELRYFDGTGWTEHVANAGAISQDPY